MARNGRTGGKTSKQDYMNLVYTDTDSDIPDLKLPPIKGKKQKRKRAGSGRSLTSGEESTGFSPGLRLALKVTFGLVCLAVLLALASALFWCLIQLRDLRQTVEALQNKDNQVELLNLKQKISEVGSNLDALKATSLTEVQKDIKKINLTLVDLTSKFKQLSSTIEETDKKEFINLPKSLHSLQDTVASATNDLLEVKGHVSNLMKLKLSDKIAQLNTSLESKIANVSRKLQDSGRSEGSSTALSPNIMQNVLQLVGSLIDEKLANVTVSADAPKEGMSSRERDAITERLHSIETFVNKDFAAFMKETEADIRVMNASLLNVIDNFSQINAQVQNHSSYLNNMATALKERNEGQDTAKLTTKPDIVETTSSSIHKSKRSSPFNIETTSQRNQEESTTTTFVQGSEHQDKSTTNIAENSDSKLSSLAPPLLPQSKEDESLNPHDNEETFKSTLPTLPPPPKELMNNGSLENSR